MTEDEIKPYLTNKILVDNLNAYLNRHPDDQDRIFDIVLRTITTDPKIEGFTCASPIDDYRARLCFIVNLMSPELWEKAVASWKSDAYFIVEQNQDAIAKAFQTIDLTKYFLTGNMHFFLGYVGDEVIAPMQRILRQTAYAGKLFLSQVLAANPGEGIEDHYANYGRSFNEVLRKTIDHVFFNFGNINDSIEGLRASFQNSDRIKTSGGITELENLHYDKPFVVVGAGPSLDYDLELLKENQHKFIIVAVDAAVKPLLAAGCRVDYAVTIERYQGGLQEQFFEGLPELETELVVYPVVHPDVINKWPGLVRFTYRNYAWYAYFERNWPMGILESGGSAGHLATRLALHMGATQIFLIGCDMSYERHQTDATFRSHCASTAFPEWNRYKTEEEIKSSKEFYGFYDVEANDGSQVKTHTIYHQWAKEYESMIIAHQMRGKLFTTAKLGVKTPRMPYIPFKDICEKAEPIDVSRKLAANQRRMSREGHDGLVENLRGFHLLISGGLETTTLLLNHVGHKRANLLNLARQLFYDKIAHDTFFTAWLIQNSAMEFFRAENVLNGCPPGALDDEHYDERVRALNGVYSVLYDISSKTLNVVEQANKGVIQ